MNQFVALRNLFGDMISHFESGDLQNTNEFVRRYQDIIGTSQDRASFMVKQLVVFYRLMSAKGQYGGVGDAGAWFDYIDAKAPRSDL